MLNSVLMNLLYNDTLRYRTRSYCLYTPDSFNVNTEKSTIKLVK